MSWNVRVLLRRINGRLCLYVVCVLLPFVLAPLAASPHQNSYLPNFATGDVAVTCIMTVVVFLYYYLTCKVVAVIYSQLPKIYQPEICNLQNSMLVAEM